MKFTLILFDLIFIGKKQKETKEVNFQAKVDLTMLQIKVEKIENKKNKKN